MSQDYRKILGDSSQVLMSDSLRQSVNRDKVPELIITNDEITVLEAYKVYSFQKNAEGIQITCSSQRITSMLRTLAVLAPTDTLELNYHETKFKNYACTQWGVVQSDLNLPGENKLELIFELLDNGSHKEILND